MRWRTGVPLLLATAMLACSDPSGDGGDLHVAIQLDQTALAQGDTARVQIMLTNTSPRTVRIAIYDCPRPFRIFDHLGREVARPSGLCNLPGVPAIDLKALQTYTYDYLWRPRDPVSGQPLEPGEYSIRGYYGEIRSEPVTIRIVE